MLWRTGEGEIGVRKMLGREGGAKGGGGDKKSKSLEAKISGD